MEFEEPQSTGFTIYTKSGCKNCTKVKQLLDDNKIPNIKISCDEYILEDKANFVAFIISKTKEEMVLFPIVFNNGVFVGGYPETKDLINKTICFEESLDF